MSDYDIFAKFYDSVMGDRTAEALHIEKLIKQYNPATKKILELGCGTGTFLKYFSDRDYDVAGIDLSEEILAIARRKLPCADLSHQNMATFSLSEKHDAILCLFDSINHLLDYKDWEKTFSRVSLHLNQNGIFIFDINMKKKLEHLARSKAIITESDMGKMIMKITSQDGAYNYNVKIIEKQNNGSEIIHEENIKEQSFPIKKIEKSLKKIFNQIVLFDQGGGQASEDSRRVYFICLNKF